MNISLLTETSTNKVAVLLCGQARFFHECYNNIKSNILDVYLPDVYIHTWKYENNQTTSAPWNNLGIIYITDDDICNYIELYKPKRHKVEKALEDKDLNLLRQEYKHTSSPKTKYNYYSYLYSLNECLKLVDTIKDYDTFIILRSDVIIYNFPTPDTKYIQLWNRLADRTDVLEAMVYTVPRDYINTFVSLVNKLDEYYDKGYYFNYEEMTHAHFKETNLYSVTKLLSKHQFEWGYFRKTHIERM